MIEQLINQIKSYKFDTNIEVVVGMMPTEHGKIVTVGYAKGFSQVVCAHTYLLLHGKSILDQFVDIIQTDLDQLDENTIAKYGVFFMCYISGKHCIRFAKCVQTVHVEDSSNIHGA